MLIEEVAARTGVPVIINTSFNGRGEPIVATPDDAIAAFRRLGLDRLFIEELEVMRPDDRRSTP